MRNAKVVGVFHRRLSYADNILWRSVRDGGFQEGPGTGQADRGVAASGADAPVVICGSLYLVAELSKKFQEGALPFVTRR